MSRFIEVHMKEVWFKDSRHKVYADSLPLIINTGRIRNIFTDEGQTVIEVDTSSFVTVEDYETLAGLLEVVGVGRNEQ